MANDSVRFQRLAICKNELFRISLTVMLIISTVASCREDQPGAAMPIEHDSNANVPAVSPPFLKSPTTQPVVTAIVEVDETDRREFDRLLFDYHRHRESPRVSVSSRIADHVDCNAIREITKAGWRYMPLMIEEIENGDFFLTRPLEEMTGIDLFTPFAGRRGRFYSAQAYAAHCVDWWNQAGHLLYMDCYSLSRD